MYNGAIIKALLKERNLKIKDLLENTEEYILVFHVQLENFEDFRIRVIIS